MIKAKTVLFLFLLGITLVPWQVICAAHPLGHEHKEHTGPSPCELRRQYDGISPVYWSPMECANLSPAVSDYPPCEDSKIKLTIPTVAILTVLFELIKFNTDHEQFLLPPDPQCRSATISSDNSLRGPPLV